MNEIEQILVSLIRRTEKTILTPEGLAKEFAPKLMEAARKQIASEIDAESITHKEWLRRKDEPFFWPANTERAFYKQGIEDCIKAIEKGE